MIGSVRFVDPARGLVWLAGLALAAAGCHPAAPAAAPRLVYASTRAAYGAGVYDGFITVAAVRALGDFGLGAADANDGELVALDGTYYRTRGDGTVIPFADRDLLSLASVTTFRADRKLHVRGPLSRAAFEARLDAWLPGPNRLFALRIHGRFARVVAGASDPQVKPYRRFSEVYPEYHLIPRTDAVGTLVGFLTPVGFPDSARRRYHFHLISDDRRTGGHVDDVDVEDVDVEAQELRRIEFVMPDTPAFYAADLAPAPVAPAPAAAPVAPAAPAPR